MTANRCTDEGAGLQECIRKLLDYGFRIELEAGWLYVRTQSGSGRMYQANDEGARQALHEYECQLAPE